MPKLFSCFFFSGALTKDFSKSSLNFSFCSLLVVFLFAAPLHGDTSASPAPFGFSTPSQENRLVQQSLLQDLECPQNLENRLCFVVGERGHFLVGSAMHWQQVILPTQSQLNALSLDGRYAVGEDGIIVAYGANGIAEVVYSDLSSDAALFSILPTASGDYLAVGAYGLCLRGKERAWRPCQIDPEERHIYDIVELRDGALLAVGEVGLIARTDGESSEFISISSPYGGSLFGVLSLESGADQYVMAYGLRGTILLSSDGGKSFHQAETSIERTFLAATQVADGRVVLVGLGGLLVEFSVEDNKILREKTLTGRPALTGIQKVDDLLLLTSDQGVLEFREWKW